MSLYPLQSLLSDWGGVRRRSKCQANWGCPGASANLQPGDIILGPQCQNVTCWLTHGGTCQPGAQQGAQSIGGAIRTSRCWSSRGSRQLPPPQRTRPWPCPWRSTRLETDPAGHPYGFPHKCLHCAPPYQPPWIDDPLEEGQDSGQGGLV